jgi:hypothetical protein
VLLEVGTETSHCHDHPEQGGGTEIREAILTALEEVAAW